MAALGHMRFGDRGTIINVGSALAYRAILLQATPVSGEHRVL
jgi:short-subunit dehydrogenase